MKNYQPEAEGARATVPIAGDTNAHCRQMADDFFSQDHDV